MCNCVQITFSSATTSPETIDTNTSIYTLENLLANTEYNISVGVVTFRDGVSVAAPLFSQNVAASTGD